MTPFILVLAVLQAPLDEGTLVVRHDTSEIGREEFRLLAGRAAAGWTLISTARFDHGRPGIVLHPTLDLAPDSTPLTLQYDVADPRAPGRIVGQAGRGRFTLRYLARGSERARELATGQTTVVLDDSVYALYLFLAWQARAAPVTLTAILPRGPRRETLTIRDLGVTATTLNRDPATLRHLAVSGGAAGTVDVWLDAAGRLMKVELPDRHIVAERLPAN